MFAGSIVADEVLTGSSYFNQSAILFLHIELAYIVSSGQQTVMFVNTLRAYSAARIVTNTRTFDHITPILQNLHRLPVRQRIHFKILFITYKYINDMAPEYQCELVSIRKSSRKLRSSSQILLQVGTSSITPNGSVKIYYF